MLRPSPAGKQIEELMIRGQHLDHDWVFAGSRIVKNPETGEEFYVADRSGELVCVSNFPTALLDLPIQSSSDNAMLGFEADEAMIPPKDFSRIFSARFATSASSSRYWMIPSMRLTCYWDSPSI